ncbi:MAG: tetratricopeptide repeat protein [Cyanobacteriota bacterium]|nr:tetratricopeptide repeat protein [Cyanobacteriota bacterium]
MATTTANKGNKWLYWGLVPIALLAAGALAFPFFLQWRDRAGIFSVAESTPASAVDSLSSQERSELETKAKGLELILQQNPNNVDALDNLVKVRLQQNDLRGALVPLEKLAQLKSQVPDYTILLAEGKQQIGDSEGAFAAYEDVLAVNPGNIKALQGMVNLLVAQNRPESAIGRLEDTLEIAAQANFANPGSMDVISIQLLLGQVYVARERLTEAIAVYDRAIEANPQDFRPLFAKAVILQQQGLEARAKPLLARAAALAPPKYKDQIAQMIAELSPEATESESPNTESESPSVEESSAAEATDEVQSE